MVNILLEESFKQGYIPDASVAGDEVPNGNRPRPFMLYKNLENDGCISNPRSCQGR